MHENLRHLLILTPGFPENESDTAAMPYLQVYVKNLARTCPGLKITVITVWYPFERRKYNWHGIEINALGIKNSKMLNYCKAVITVVVSALSLNKSYPVGLLHSFYFPLALHGNLISGLLGIPHVNTIIGGDGATKTKSTGWINLSRVHIVTLSACHNQSFFKAFGRNSDSIIPFGLDATDFPEIPAGRRTIDILGVGALYPVKNFSLFIDIIIRLLADYPDLRICIVGNGSEKEMLQKKIDAAGVEKNIALTDSLPREKVLLKMQQSRIFLHTSDYESQGYVFYEASYAGCQLVSTAVGVAEASAQWKICRTPEELLTTLRTLLSGRFENCQEMRFPVGKTVAQYRQIYNSLVAKKIS